jgi:hypothetical protein
MATALLFLEHVRLNFTEAVAVSLTGSVAEPRGYAKKRQCDTAGRPLRNAEQYRYGIRTSLFWWVRENVKLSRSNAGCLDVPDVEVCTSPARELPQADHSPRVGKARLMRRETDYRNAVIDPADSDYSFKGGVLCVVFVEVSEVHGGKRPKVGVGGSINSKCRRRCAIRNTS